jgi:hypothetical protein
MISFSRQAGLALVLILIGLSAGFWVRGHAQGRGLIEPGITVLSGSDLGFRVEGRRGATPTGTLVVRVDGKWVEAELSSRVRVLPVR